MTKNGDINDPPGPTQSNSLARQVVPWLLLLCVALVFSGPIAGAESYKASYQKYRDYAEKGDWKNASDQSYVAYNLAKEELGKNSGVTARLAHNYALSLLRLNKKAGAKLVFAEALTSYTLAFGEGSVELIPLYLDIADNHIDVLSLGGGGSKVESKNALVKTLQISESHYGPSSLAHAQTLQQVGYVYSRLGDKRGNKRLKEARRLFLDLEGKQNAYANVTYTMGTEARRNGNAKKAVRLLQEALAVIDAGAFDDESLRLNTQLEIARAFHDRGDKDQKQRYRVDALKTAKVIGDTGLQLIARVDPERPRKSAWRNKYEWTSIEYDVNEAGDVISPKLIASSGVEVFNAAALEAISKFQYLPRVVDGRAVISRGLAEKFVFYR